MSYTSLLKLLMEKNRVDSKEALVEKEFSKVEPRAESMDRFKPYIKRSRGSVRLFLGLIRTPEEFRKIIRDNASVTLP